MSSTTSEPIRERDPRPHKWRRLLLRFVWTGIALFGAGFLWTQVVFPDRQPREAARRTQCKNNLKQIGFALRNYRDRFGTLPPAYIANDRGRPIHSWRVLLLPYLGQQALYDQYRFDESWDGPNNRQLMDVVLQAYQCPSESSKHDMGTTTSYVAIVGVESAWPEDRSLRFRDFTDGLFNTLLVVEISHSGIHWMEPRDLSTIQMARTVNSPIGQGISSMHTGGAQVLLGDGTVKFISQNLPQEILRALITPNGGEGPQEF